MLNCDAFSRLYTIYTTGSSTELWGGFRNENMWIVGVVSTTIIEHIVYTSQHSVVMRCDKHRTLWHRNSSCTSAEMDHCENELAAAAALSDSGCEKKTHPSEQRTCRGRHTASARVMTCRRFVWKYMYIYIQWCSHNWDQFIIHVIYSKSLYLLFFVFLYTFFYI